MNKKNCYWCKYFDAGDCDYMYGIFSPDSCKLQNDEIIDYPLLECPYFKWGILGLFFYFISVIDYIFNNEQDNFNLPYSKNISKEKRE